MSTFPVHKLIGKYSIALRVYYLYVTFSFIFNLVSNAQVRMFADLIKLYNAAHAYHILYFTFGDKKLLTTEGRRSMYGGEQFYQYAKGIGEGVKSGIDPNSINEYLHERGFSFYECCSSNSSGISGHISPDQQAARYLSQHPFIRPSEVFHSALAIPTGKS